MLRALSSKPHVEKKPRVKGFLLFTGDKRRIAECAGDTKCLSNFYSGSPTPLQIFQFCKEKAGSVLGKDNRREERNARRHCLLDFGLLRINRRISMPCNLLIPEDSQHPASYLKQVPSFPNQSTLLSHTSTALLHNEFSALLTPTTLRTGSKAVGPNLPRLLQPKLNSPLPLLRNSIGYCTKESVNTEEETIARL